MPTTNAPTPVQIAYAVGMTRCAHKSNAPLAGPAELQPDRPAVLANSRQYKMEPSHLPSLRRPRRR
jgi:hypothetical protein